MVAKKVAKLYGIDFTCIVLTNLLESSKTAIAVDVLNECAPFCIPLTMRPSCLYCSTGIQNKSFRPWNSCMKLYAGPTPPRILCSWFCLISFSHSLMMKLTSLSAPSKPLREHRRFSLSSEQLSCDNPIMRPANVP